MGKYVFDKNTSKGLKGIAIIMMLIHHMYRTADRFSGFSVKFYPLQEQNIIRFAEACKICVAIYAFISGYGLFLSYKENKGSAQKWVAKRYVQTFSEYWLVWVIITLITQLKFRRFTSIMNVDGKAAGVVYGVINFLGLSNLFGTPTMDYRWWYMSAAVVFIFLTPLIYKHRNELWLALVCEVFFLRVIFVHYNDLVAIGGEAVYAFIFSFVLGSIFARYNLFDKWAQIGIKNYWLKIYKLIAEVWLLVVFYYLYHNAPRDIFWEIHYGIFPLVLILFCVEFILHLPVFKNLLSFLGRHSFDIFLVHSFILYYCPKYIYQKQHFITTVLILLCTSVVLSYLIKLLKGIMRYDKLIEHIKCAIDKMTV